ncbi:MAG: carboxylesterase family protein [Prosthecobacter sp.]|nr:carboxylesterase family protein [Prosthecobacter sp.]
MRPTYLTLCVLCALSGALTAADTPAKAPAKPKAEKPKAAPLPKPTFANVAYGTHERQVLDFWKVESDKPTPLLFYIHGGGWMAGDKAKVGALQKMLDAGISVVSINYR